MHGRFMPHLLALAKQVKSGQRLLDVGCGNGFACGEFLRRGWQVTGIDLSESGIAIARHAYPTGKFEVLPADENVLKNLNEAAYDLVISTEVVEHLYAPRPYVRGCFAALKPGGCHRAEQNQPEVSDSKPATLKCGIHIISGFSIKGFLLRVKTSRTGQRAF